jgi:forkhead box protein N
MMQSMQHNLSPTSMMDRPSLKPIQDKPGSNGNKDSLPSASQMQEMQRQQQQQVVPQFAQPPQFYASAPGTPTGALNMSTSSLASANWMCARSPGVNGMNSEYAGSPVHFNTFQVIPGQQYGGAPMPMHQQMTGIPHQQPHQQQPQCQTHPGQQCGCVPTTTWTPTETTLGKKPPYSFPCLIGLALRSGETGRMSVSQIYDHITGNFPYFRSAKAGWKNSVRHNLSLNKIFCKLERLDSEAGKGAMWGITEVMKEQLDRDILQCQQRYPQKIIEAMKEPEPLAAVQPQAQQQQQQPQQVYQMQQHPMQTQQYAMMGTNPSGQIIFGNSPPRPQHPSLAMLGRASSAPSMPMVMSVHATDPNSSLFDAFASPPKQLFNQPLQTFDTPGMNGAGQPQAPGSHHQLLPLASRRISLPGDMELTEQMFDSRGFGMIDDLIHHSGTAAWQNDSMGPNMGMASPTKIIGDEIDNGLRDFVPASLYEDDFSDVTDDVTDLENIKMDSLLYNQPASIKMES